MNLTGFSIRYDRFTYLILLVIGVMGALAYSQLARDSMPPYTIRVCTVVTRFPGAGPERVEQLITDKVEQAAQELAELKTVTSESRTGLSIVQVEVQPSVPERDLQPIWDRLRRKVEDVREELPDESQDPNVKDDGVGVVYGIMLGLEGDGFTFSELEDYAKTIRDDLVKLPDAAEVELRGIQEEQVFVEFDNAKLAEIGLTTAQVQNIIASTNIVFPGGDVSLDKKRIVLEPTGNYEAVEDLANTLVPVGGGETVKLGEITTISRGYESPYKNRVRVNGNTGIAISVSLRDGANLIELGEVINDKIAQYNQELPLGISLARAASQDYYVQDKVNNFVSNVGQSIITVLAVMLLFLGLRTGLIVASLIPMTMLMTLFLMDFFGIGLNQVSLAALIMALGLLVDNAIVVSELIMVKVEEGQNGREAAIGASKELAIPLLISSLTTSAAFLSFFLADNVMGEIMGPLFSVISLALISSWLLALTLVAMLSALFIRAKKRQQQRGKGTFDRLAIYYQRVLMRVLRNPIFFLVGLVLVFAFSLWLFPRIPFIFFPDSDRNLVTLDLNLPLGTKIERTESVVREIEEFLGNELQVEVDSEGLGVRSWSAFVGEGPASYDLGYQPGEANSGYAHMLINTSSFLANDKVTTALDSFCFNRFPDAIVTVGPLAGGGGGGPDVEVRLSGDDPAKLFAITESIKQRMVQIEGAKNIRDSWGPKIKKFVVDIDQDRANRAGLSNQDIAVSLRTALSGTNSGSFRQGDDNIPIIMRQRGNADIRAQELNSLNIFAQNSGQNVPLMQVADVETDWQYAKILRRDLFRTITVSCEARQGYTATMLTEELSPWLEKSAQQWKRGYRYELGGESEQSGEALGAVGEKLPLSAFIILLLLMAQFNSFRRTLIVLATIPLGLIGVILGLYLFDSFFGFMAVLGLISLAGIVINNAIVLLDRIKIEMDENGREPFPAIVEAANQRFRPILLTTFTTSLGLIPLYLGGGALWEPMAIGIIVGLLFATVITLLFIPVLYRLLFRIPYAEEKVERR